MSSTQTSNNKRRRASTSTHHEESTAIRARTTVVMAIASSGFESLIDDTHDLILQFVGKRSYGYYGSINKRCREVFLSKNLPKETFLYGYAPLSTIIEKFNRFYNEVGQAIVAYNRNDILQWLMLEKRKWEIRETFNSAAGVGLKTLKRVMNDVGDDAFITMKINENWDVSDSAACGERLDVLKWLKTKGWFNQSGISAGMETAAKKGNIPVLKWLIENGCELYDCVFPSAAEGGHLNMLEFLKEKNFPLDPEDCMLHAARGGSLETIQWLLRNGCSFDDVDEQVVKEAAREGHLHVLEFFIENGLSINDIGEYVSCKAAEKGCLHILQWLHENNCTFDEWTFAYAARNGNIDNLQWLLENSFPWDKECYSSAALFSINTLEVLEWLKEKGCPKGNSVLVVLDNHDLSSEAKDWIHENGFTVHLRRRMSARRVTPFEGPWSSSWKTT